MLYQCFLRAVLILLVGCWWTPSSCQGSPLTFQVELNTAPLTGNPAGPFSVDFQLIDGSGAGDDNNTASIGALSFGGGNPSGAPTLVGGASGDSISGVQITDTGFLNEFIQRFIAGTKLSFQIQLTTNPDVGFPDGFTFAILDAGGNTIPTESLSFALVAVDLDLENPSI